MSDTGKCANCGQVTVDGSTLCVDCLVACNVRVKNENTSLLAEMEKYGGEALDALKEKDDELICLRLQLKLSRSLMRHVFVEYQKLVKLQGGNGGEIA